ncbi:MAG: hypothetical protein PF541_14450 [Prolixibacteraceae bacterium]|jgi:hypothetical protein|nr:hypothetical protein [Prolixibacteraceae bacterium]
MKRENIYNNIDEVLNNIPDNYKIMEETIDLDVQKDFFESTKNLEIDPQNDKIEKLIEQINHPNENIDTIKVALQKLALIDSVEAYRAIEKYNELPNELIKDWSLLSLQQSKMVMQSSLLDEQQVFISTGLGGKNNNLRYYLIFPYNNTKHINKTQSSSLKSELLFFIEKNCGEVEEIDFLDSFASAMVLLPIKTPIPQLIKDILKECNQLGNFLTDNVMITNMKKFNTEEVIQILEQYDQKQS